ncbi:acyltransferase family protein [Priestia abyssalis]|uniref:acyltransferase family protein n=1 Tax=Priestia abyssalis TaxID=1221450 RepID=UPI00147672A5|nr:acyltransferase family protein [Priestia abyssalis]
MKQTMNEVFWLRSIACLTVVLLHAISSTILAASPDPESSTAMGLRSLQLLMMYGTPMFVFISEFLIAYRYRDGVRKGFFRKRVKFILLPYIIMGLFYAWVYQHNHGLDSVLSKWGEHVFFGAYHGYFILIIFQFYILHMLLDRFLRKANMKAVLLAALIINIAYLAFFNFNEPEAYDLLPVVWTRLTILPFFGWLFYFVAGYYAGRHFDAFKRFIASTRKWHLPLYIGAALLVLNLYWTEALVDISSKRFDMIFLTMAVMALIVSFASRMKDIPAWLVTVSQYSFGIYLLHPFFQHTLSLHAKDWIKTDNIFLLVSIFFLAGVVLPIIVTYMLNRIPYGHYIVGKVGIGTKKKRTDETTQRTNKAA